MLGVDGADWDETIACGLAFAPRAGRAIGVAPQLISSCAQTMNLSRLLQAIRIVRALLPAAVMVASACAADDIAWTDPLTMATASDDARLTVDTRGRARLVADTTFTVSTATDAAACMGSTRAARLDDGSLVASWWSLRPDSSTVLVAARSPDGGATWEKISRVDTMDVAPLGCNRPAPAIAVSSGFVHLAYSMRASEGVGVFYAHSMNGGQSYEPPVTILYGDRLSEAAIAADKGTVAVAYEDPSGSSPQIGLAISRDWGHIFRDRTNGSTGVGSASDPDVAVADREIAVSWLVGAVSGVRGAAGGGRTNSNARWTRIVRVGRLP
jgi:hypothetical protein